MEVWSAERANEWYAKNAWQVGCNYLPATAVNSTEMWQESTFDEPTIRRELAWASAFGYNSVRVFLPFIVWEKEREGFLATFETFLSIAAENGLTVLPILFDDCAFDKGRDPFYGEQEPPIPGKHNGRWTPSPGSRMADDPTKQDLLREYVHAIVGAHRNDERIFAWDLYNEPGGTSRRNLCLPLLVNVFRWARECEPVQPLTSGPWRNKEFDSTYYAMLELSDVISCHLYLPLEQTEAYIERLMAYDKPIFVTEWLFREENNTFESILPYFAENKISCWNWGLVVGKTQTNLWYKPTDPPSEIWQHDVLYPNGEPYCAEESVILKKLRSEWANK